MCVRNRTREKAEIGNNGKEEVLIRCQKNTPYGLIKGKKKNVESTEMKNIFKKEEKGSALVAHEDEPFNYRKHSSNVTTG